MNAKYTINEAFTDPVTGMISVVSFSVTLTDDDFPGAEVQAGGIIPIEPQPVTASNEALIAALEKTGVYTAPHIQAFTREQLQVIYVTSNGTKIVKSDT